MKSYLKILPFVLVMALSSGKTKAQANPADSTGVPGDNFDLQGALQMFQKASSPEDFERLINSQDNNVNNLDLNGDGETDYIKVIDKMDGDVHAFVLQVPVSDKESQDIAVIELEKTGDTTAILQIIGDEEIYGEQVIVEPDGGGDDAAYINWSNNSNLSGPDADYESTYLPRIVVNVWLWPSVRFVYTPYYRPWISPWRWRYYPSWWRPWRPLHWHVWHPRRVHYHTGFVVVHTHRVGRAHRVYTPYRSTSVTVRTRHSVAVNNYRVSRTKTSVTGPRGKTTTVKKTTVTGPRGNKATKVKVRRH